MCAGFSIFNTPQFHHHISLEYSINQVHAEEREDKKLGFGFGHPAVAKDEQDDEEDFAGGETQEYVGERMLVVAQGGLPPEVEHQDSNEEKEPEADPADYPMGLQLRQGVDEVYSGGGQEGDGN
jgi:hypothetical protein